MIQSRQLIHAYAQLSTSQSMTDSLSNSLEMTSMPAYTPTLMTPLPLQHHYEQSPQLSVKSNSTIRIGYILCRDLLIQNQEASYITVEPKHDTMEFLIRQICQINAISESLLTLELFGQSGYPLNVNMYTMKCEFCQLQFNNILHFAVTIEKWKIQNNDIFYMFIRRREQPITWAFDDLKDNDQLDPLKGGNLFTIIFK